MKYAFILITLLLTTTNVFAMERSHKVKIGTWLEVTVYERMRLMTDIYFQDEFVDTVLISDVSLNSLVKSLEKIKVKWEKADDQTDKIGGCLDSELREEVGRIKALTLGRSSNNVTFYFKCSAAERYLTTFASDKYVINTVLSNQSVEQLSLLIFKLKTLREKIKNR
jgi:hypothetical protein